MNEEQELKRCRDHIDALDTELLMLINKRATLALRASQIKVKYQGPEAEIYRPEREAEILKKITALNQGPLENSTIRVIFQSIITQCRKLEQKHGK